MKIRNASGQCPLGWLRSKRIVVRTGEEIPQTLWGGMTFLFRLVNEVRNGIWVVWEVTVEHKDTKGVKRTLKEIEIRQVPDVKYTTFWHPRLGVGGWSGWPGS